MGFLPKWLTPPKSIRKFQFKKLGNKDWWKEFAGDVALPAALGATGLGLAGLGPLSALGGIGGKVGGLAKAGLGKLGGIGGIAKAGAGQLGGMLGGQGGELALGGMDAVLNARRAAEADKLRGMGVEQVQLQNKTRADLLGRALGLDPSAKGPDLSSVFADPSNPFAIQSPTPPGPGLPPPRRPPKVAPTTPQAPPAALKALLGLTKRDDPLGVGATGPGQGGNALTRAITGGGKRVKKNKDDGFGGSNPGPPTLRRAF